MCRWFVRSCASCALVVSSSLSLIACTGGGGSAEGGGEEASEASEGETSEEEGETGEDTGPIEPEVDWPQLDCDPLVPTHCALPFPNNVFSVEDGSSNTGRRLALAGPMMPVGAGYTPDTSSFNMSDGFSMASTLMAHFPGATTTGLPTPVTIEDSLASGSPTVLLDAETLERVPHWAEFDMSHDDDERRAFLIRPAIQLDPGRRYIAAVRNLVDAEGETLEASPAFAALRDETASEEPSVDARRGLYADIFERLDEAGIDREELQLAWDFSTASDANITERAVHIRDAGMEALPSGGPEYEVVSVDMDPYPGVAMRIEVDVTVPLFLDTPESGGSLQYGSDGLPAQNGTATYPVLIHVPESAYDTPAKLVAYGHGMLGSRTQIAASHLVDFCANGNVIVFATDWVGMAEDDLGNIATMLTTGHIDDFHTVPDRLQQGFLNAFVAMEMLRTSFAQDPLMTGPNGSLVDPSESWYFGGSQGGIFGSPYMALSPHVQRGVLAVPGQPYNLLLNRSVNFADFFALIDTTYPDKIDLRLLIELVQIEWDRAEPSGFSRHIINDPLPGSTAKEVLSLVSIGDHQVTTLGAHLMARELGIPQVGPAARPDLFGIDVVSQPYTGSAMVEYDFGLPPEPIVNLPMSEGEDPHGKLGGIPEAGQTVENFLRTGVVETYCTDVCDPD